MGKLSHKYENNANSSQSLYMVSVTIQVQGLNDQQGYEEVTGCSRNSILLKDAESPVDSEKNAPRSFTDGRSEKRDDDAKKKEAARLTRSHTERKSPGEGLLARYG